MIHPSNFQMAILLNFKWILFQVFFKLTFALPWDILQNSKWLVLKNWYILSRISWHPLEVFFILRWGSVYKWILLSNSCCLQDLSSVTQVEDLIPPIHWCEPRPCHSLFEPRKREQSYYFYMTSISKPLSLWTISKAKRKKNVSTNISLAE